MRKSLFLLFLTMVFTSGCSINFAAETNKVDTVQNSNPHPIRVSIYKHYEDGVDLKFELLNGQKAKGTWTIQDCGQEEKQTNKGAIVIHGVVECEIPIGHENDKNYYTMYINFTGMVNGKKVTSDKVYVVNYDEVDKVPLERQNPDSGWVMLQTFIKTGYLYGASVHIGSTKAEIIDFFGEPESISPNGNVFDYGNAEFYIYGNHVEEIKMKNTKEFPIDLPNNDKDDLIRVFGNPDEIHAEDGIYYSTYYFGKRTATFAWDQKENKLISVDVIKS